MMASPLMLCHAGDGELVSKTAKDISAIEESFAQSEKPLVFAADLIQALAKMPKSPVAKLRSMAQASSSLFGLADQKSFPSMVVAVISKVPFDSLPEWTRLLVPSAKARVDGMDEQGYRALLSDVLGQIGKIKDYSDDDKTIISSFALKLLLRDGDAEWETTHLKAVPDGYRKNLADALPAVLKGEYAALLGDTEIVELPKGAEPVAVFPPSRTDVPAAGVENLAISTSGSESIAVAVPAAPPSPPAPPAPPVAPPYKGQF